MKNRSRKGKKRRAQREKTEKAKKAKKAKDKKRKKKRGKNGKSKKQKSKRREKGQKREREKETGKRGKMRGKAVPFTRGYSAAARVFPAVFRAAAARVFPAVFRAAAARAFSAVFRAAAARFSPLWQTAGTVCACGGHLLPPLRFWAQNCNILSRFFGKLSPKKGIDIDKFTICRYKLYYESVPAGGRGVPDFFGRRVLPVFGGFTWLDSGRCGVRRRPRGSGYFRSFCGRAKNKKTKKSAEEKRKGTFTNE